MTASLSRAHDNRLISLMMISFLLFSSNFMNYANYSFILVVSVSLLYSYINLNKIHLNTELLVLTVCFTSYYLIYKQTNSFSVHSFITLWLSPILGYLIGYLILNLHHIHKTVKKVVFYLLLGQFIHGILNMILFFSSGGNGRMVPDIWLGYEIVATLQGTFFTMTVSLLFYSLFHLKWNSAQRWVKVLLLSAIGMCCISSIATASRTLLYILIIVFACNALLYMWLNKTYPKRIMKFLIMFSIFSIVSLVLYQLDLFGMKTAYEASPLYDRVENIGDRTDPRIQAYKNVLTQSIQYPMGGEQIQMSLNYAHNLWLDTLRITGLIPFTLLLLYTMITGVTLIKLLRNRKIEQGNKFILCSVFLALNLNFLVEPILQGVPYLFVMMCIINGITKKYLDCVKELEA